MKTHSNRNRTEAECLNALHRAATKLGSSPSKAQYVDTGLTPAASTIMRVMGGWNAAKEAAGLTTATSRGSRVAPKPEDVELLSGTDWADLSANQRWYYKHQPEDIAEKRRRRTEIRTWLYHYKGQAGCEHCGEDDPACLEFHHLPGQEKRMNVGKMVAYGHGKHSIRSEIEKCEVLCSNCHRREHHDSPIDETTQPVHRIRVHVRAHRVAHHETRLTKQRYLRTWTAIYKRQTGCSRCDVSDARCLEFHHDDPDTKTAGVGAMISDSYPAEAVADEVEVCSVLCSNCHRKEHYDRPDPCEVDTQA